MTKALGIGLSHSPLKSFVDPPAEQRAAIDASVDRARQALETFSPDLVVVFFPDHFNGFFMDLMPPFCIGAAGEAIGDYGTPAGPISVDEKLAEDCAQYVMDQEIDLSISYQMTLDHGLAQPLEELAGGFEKYEILPVFINCVAPPFVPMRRAIKLGRAIGQFLSGTGRRVAYIGSGGLSHDPPLPRLHSATPEQRAMLLGGRDLTPEQRDARQQRVISAGKEFAADGGAKYGMRDLNPEWDEHFLDKLELRDFAAIDVMATEDVTRDGGNSAHEVRAWVGAFAALEQHGSYSVRERFYTPVPEWIAGFGALVAETE